MRPAAPPPISGHQDTIDGVRAVAALAVLVFHVASSAGTITNPDGPGWLFNGGQIGVPIFFALSGLLLYRPWAAAALDGRPSPRTITYLRRRVLRIMPAYWAVIVVFMVTAGRDHIGDPVTWASLMTLTQTYVPDAWWPTGLGPSHLGQFWSLAVEVAWYVTLPVTAAVLAWYARRTRTHDVGVRARRLLVGIGVYASLSLPWSVVLFVPERQERMGLFLPRYFAWFAIGMALAVVTVWARLDDRRPVAALCRAVSDSWAACWAAAAMLYVVAATPAAGPLSLQDPDVFWTSVLHVVVFGLCAAAFVAPVALAPAGQPVLGAILGNPVMRFLGRISYGVFLWQLLIIVSWYDAADRTFRGDVATDLPLMAAATIAAGTLSYYLVEWPVQRLARRRDRARPAPAPVPSS
ncbi:Peptidoglycan/LPS O-acetylase OafA/YrhL, contains acyltransferase and SGNH-hydrolase domains [Actinomadura meyerae]|uniref:Peptidoglycan/LPS O-acetylase OafA/YrhL, contains acyltransferase and SGNH-hydrolase domains n=1 Tax=Actinomadura meyerae TaxID=240840 RepID=A0A239I219_9ACTN|nr:acyltransferase [Actinomadura meyerae]SNS87569.1 Peptidoglycan/LPS O-acetylase OafA/YrhL, contains acyltransferase and SGNH-hydrolase domains [Actinomadura meyerae]